MGSGTACPRPSEDSIRDEDQGYPREQSANAEGDSLKTHGMRAPYQHRDDRRYRERQTMKADRHRREPYNPT